MKELLLKLLNASGPSGSETHIRQVITQLVTPFVDDIKVDVLGNLIVYKKGSGAIRKSVLLEANMDEPGVMSIHAEDRGFVRIVGVGNIQAAQLIGEPILFTNNVRGVVGVESGKTLKDIAFADLYVDLGCDTKEEAERLLPIGTAGIIEKPSFMLGEHRIVGKCLDNRAGCAVVIQVLSQLKEYTNDVYAIFSVQEEVGSRGIKAAAFQTEADLALMVGTTQAGDTPKGARKEIQLGNGPAIKVMDKGIIVPPAIKQMLMDLAKTEGISFQLEISPDQTSDAGQILLTRDGIPTGAVTIPIRYAHSTSQIADLRDVEQARELVLKAVLQFT